MIIWKERNRKPVLEGAVRERRGLASAIRETASSAFVLALSLLALTVLLLGVVVQVATPNHFSVQFLQSDAIDWFKRLVGPFLTATVASSSVVYLQWRKGRVPRAIWFVEGSSSRLQPKASRKARQRHSFNLQRDGRRFNRNTPDPSPVEGRG